MDVPSRLVLLLADGDVTNAADEDVTAAADGGVTATANGDAGSVPFVHV
jgi:hypothetical protein